MKRFLRGLLLTIAIALATIVAIPAIGLAYGWIATDAVEFKPLDAGHDPAARGLEPAHRAAIANYDRAIESTYLTYPEWSIVYAARDFAAFVATRSPSDFPYWAYVGRYWKDYAVAIRATSGHAFNTENHLMLVVIGISHTIEHVVQSVYENTVGRITGLTVDERGSPQDRFLAQTAADYARFLDSVPWYEFPYTLTLDRFMATHEPSGWPRVRAWERKVAYGISFSIKQFYADLISGGLSATSDPALLAIHVLAAGNVEAAIDGIADTAIVLDLEDGRVVFVTPRYQALTDRVPDLVDSGVRFIEIGGNDEILLTVMGPGPVAPPAGTQFLFSHAIPTTPELTRTGLRASVRRLHEIVPALRAADATLEHLYDY